MHSVVLVKGFGLEVKKIASGPVGAVTFVPEGMAALGLELASQTDV
jgi:hypothetical protein